MKFRFILSVILILNACQTDQTPDSDKKGKEIEKSFQDVDSLLKLDNGKFWGRQLYGPILFVDRDTRKLYANENNPDETFKKVSAYYTDSLPVEINMANTAFSWKGKRWSMVMLPLPEDKFTRNTLLIHELFHRIQPEIGFDNIPQTDNSHLDIYEGRLLLKLELEALIKALVTTDDVRKNHITNALLFRTYRHKSEDIKTSENALELNEGLAEYTAVMLSGRDQKEMINHFSESKSQFYNNPTFVRSFAYQTIPMYGYLLSLQDMHWHKETNDKTNLTDIFMSSFQITPEKETTLEDIALEYSYNEIRKYEQEREEKRLKKITDLKLKFIDSPVLEIIFENMNISFDPRNLTPLEEYGTVYPNLRITDNWGILTVENGSLMSSDWSMLRVSAPNKITDSLVKGDGWSLELKPNWTIQAIGDSFKLIKEL
ncbi:MAG: hypothetical protein HKO96_07090 [Flavobacteriaceae bacterium]|nr:hypothetical protein [Bacteroidia bacterium]NNK70227.1 hypothetical protein [Flavobacteriaceae bacterium]